MRETVKTQGKVQSIEVFTSSSQEAFSRSEACAQHMTGMRRVMTDSDSWFRKCLMGKCLMGKCLTGKAFLRDTRETFCFANLSYLIYQVSTHITHIC